LLINNEGSTKTQKEQTESEATRVWNEEKRHEAEQLRLQRQMCRQEDAVKEAKAACKDAEEAVDSTLKKNTEAQAMSLEEIIRIVERDQMPNAGMCTRARRP
jgi:predicted  nucleic acid-binding Zn-ribbon protein